MGGGSWVGIEEEERSVPASGWTYNPPAGSPTQDGCSAAEDRHINARAVHEAQHCGFPPGKEVRLYRWSYRMVAQSLNHLCI